MADQNSREGLENLSNYISRRTFLEVAVKGVFASLVSLALGNLQVRPAFASHVLCCDESGNLCPGCPIPCFGGICPSGYVKCTTASGCGYCYYASGSWTCGGGNVICYDCWSNSNCGSACTCPVTSYCGP
jgi:hypothetical protein